MIVIGIFLAVLAAALGTTSKQLIAASEHLKKPWLFHLGASMNILLGPIVDASAYAFAPQVIVAPFACLDVIFNALTAPYTLHWQNEKLTKSHLQGTAMVALGAVFTSVFASADNKVLTVYELEDQLFFRPTSLAYLALELAAIASASLALKKRWMSPQFRGVSLGVIAGVLMGNVFFLKGLIGIIQTTASTGDFHAWLRPTPWVLAACAAGGAIGGHMFMRKGLGEYKGVFMVTIFEGAHISAACLSGCVVMEEMVGVAPWRYITYWCSVGGIVGGMFVINKKAAEAQIEGKFHIAQSFAEVSGDEEEGGHVRATTFGKLEDNDTLTPVVQDMSPAASPADISLKPRDDFPLDVNEIEITSVKAPFHQKDHAGGFNGHSAGNGRLRNSPRIFHQMEETAVD
mmetsp:Transcript_35167/g.75857  ORF Transcript_35167/g.75857 Transcript_35167/m.75857 type:complete len:402 (-) Transcript_35167:198-1403(-)